MLLLPALPISQLSMLVDIPQKKFKTVTSLREGRVSSVMCMPVYWSVYLSTYITRKPHGWSSTKFFCACCPWTWIGPPLTMLWYIMTSGFVDTLCFYGMRQIGSHQAWHYISMKFARWQHQFNVRQLVLGQCGAQAQRHTDTHTPRHTADIKADLHQIFFAHVACGR